jgi:2OG-Fe(II) oxygenase superfamily
MKTMMPIETLSPYSIEGFLDAATTARVLAEIQKLLAAAPPDAFQAGAGGRSVHSFSGAFGGTSPAAVFEPAGRIEINVLPEEVRALLDDAFFRRIEDVRRVYPSATWPRGWTYVEYRAGQLCTPHADSASGGRNVAACNVLLDDSFTGGEFFIETCGSQELWMPGEVMLGPWSTYNSEWFRAVPKTRWTTRPARGTAIFYGSQLVHGTQPVTEGVARKVICWLEADTPLGAFGAA